MGFFIWPMSTTLVRYETFRIAPLMSKRTIHVPDEGRLRRKRGNEAGLSNTLTLSDLASCRMDVLNHCISTKRELAATI